MSSAPLTIFWFRRDLRIDDNHGLSQALATGQPLLPLFIFDTQILKKLERTDARVTFIHQAVTKLSEDLAQFGHHLQMHFGSPREVFADLIAKHKISTVFTNEDYEPYAIQRDQEIEKLLKKNGIGFQSFKDQVLFAKDEVVKDDGSPYRVFTPFSRRWLAKAEKIPNYNSRQILNAAPAAPRSARSLTLEDLGFQVSKVLAPKLDLKPNSLKKYAEQRDFLALDATSKIGVHLRFGTVSVRSAIRLARSHSAIWLKELIWREFFQMILFHFPHTAEEPFDPRFKKFPWRENDKDFERWCRGETGYPIVDAAMHELNETGFMHNRARMIVGSFLTKHLLLDWRKGERYFAARLFDFDLASNVGNWQWVAGCGVDAAPYFRIFNPALQAKKFDAQGDYVRRWSGKTCESMVDHEHARRRALTAYAKIKGIKI